MKMNKFTSLFEPINKTDIFNKKFQRENFIMDFFTKNYWILYQF